MKLVIALFALICIGLAAAKKTVEEQKRHERFKKFVFPHGDLNSPGELFEQFAPAVKQHVEGKQKLKAVLEKKLNDKSTSPEVLKNVTNMINTLDYRYRSLPKGKVERLEGNVLTARVRPNSDCTGDVETYFFVNLHTECFPASGFPLVEDLLFGLLGPLALPVGGLLSPVLDPLFGGRKGKPKAKPKGKPKAKPKGKPKSVARRNLKTENLRHDTEKETEELTHETEKETEGRRGGGFQSYTILCDGNREDGTMNLVVAYYYDYQCSDLQSAIPLIDLIDPSYLDCLSFLGEDVCGEPLLKEPLPYALPQCLAPPGLWALQQGFNKFGLQCSRVDHREVLKEKDVVNTRIYATPACAYQFIEPIGLTVLPPCGPDGGGCPCVGPGCPPMGPPREMDLLNIATKMNTCSLRTEATLFGILFMDDFYYVQATCNKYKQTVHYCEYYDKDCTKPIGCNYEDLPDSNYWIYGTGDRGQCSIGYEVTCGV